MLKKNLIRTLSEILPLIRKKSNEILLVIREEGLEGGERVTGFRVGKW